MKNSNSEHSVYGGSSIERIVKCPRSVKMCEGETSAESDAAIEGTKAHACLEYMAKKLFIEKLEAGIALRKTKHAATINDWCADMVAYARQACSTISKKIKILGPDAVVTFEKRLDSSAFTENGQFSTADIVVYSRKKRHIWLADYKYGYRVVNERKNFQLRYYGLAAILNIGWNLFDTYEFSIIQPRAWHIDGTVRSIEGHKDDLVSYGKKVKTAVKISKSKDAPLVYGKKQCSFCAGKYKCPEFKKRTFTMAKKSGLPINAKNIGVEITEKNAGKLLKAIDRAQDLMKAIRYKIFVMALNGAEIEGYKLVNNRAVRKWQLDAKAIKKLEKEFGPDAFAPKKILSPAQFEKIFKSKKAKKFLKENTSKISNGLTLVEEKDNRKALSRVDEAFN